MDTFFSLGQLHEMKRNQPRPGFELELLIPFPTKYQLFFFFFFLFLMDKS